MPKTTSLRDLSRTEWTTDIEDCWPGFDRVNMGSLQRIADATEKMAMNYDRLINDRDWYQKECKRLNAEVEHLKRSRAAHKADATKLRQRLAEEGLNA